MGSIAVGSYTRMLTWTKRTSSIVMRIDSSTHDTTTKNTSLVTLAEIEIWYRTDHRALLTSCRNSLLR